MSEKLIDSIRNLKNNSQVADEQKNRERGSLPWGFYILAAGALWAIVELIRAILYFFG